MEVRSVRPLKKELRTFKEAQDYIRKLRIGKGADRYAQVAIHYNPLKVMHGKWSVVVEGEPLPKVGSPCVECQTGLVLEIDDYLCPECRQAAQS